MKISSYKSTIKKQLKPVVFFFLRFIKRSGSFFFFTSEMALRKASSKLVDQPDNDFESALIEKFQSADLVVKNDVISIPLSAGKEKEFSGGLVDSQTGCLISEAIHLMGEPCQEMPKEIDLNVETEINHTVFFGGILYDNFGHVLLESISRLWAYKLVEEADPYIYFFVPWDTPKYLRGGTATAVLDSYLILIGGENADPKALRHTEALDVKNNKWTRWTDLQEGRHGTQAINYKNAIYITSGAGNQGGSNLLNSQEFFYMPPPIQ